MHEPGLGAEKDTATPKAVLAFLGDVTFVGAGQGNGSAPLSQTAYQ
jgi:hypothetical protein